MLPEPRTTRFHMVMTATERSMLQALAAKAGLNESDIVRLHIREAYAKQFGDKPPSRTKAKRKP